MAEPGLRVADLLAPRDVLCGLRAADKRGLLGELARRGARTLDLDAGLLLDALLAREALGSTGIGGGIALPHARLREIARPFGMLARIRAPIPFDAVDERDVDLVFLLVLSRAAGEASLSALACAARRLREPAVAAALRAAPDAAALHAALTGVAA